MTDTWNRCADTAERAVRAGYVALRPYWERSLALDVAEKGSHDFVTEADLASQRAVATVIAGEHPDHLLLGEEGEGARLEGDRPVWIVDPLDGTTNFIHGNPVFGVSVGCWHEGRVVAGAVLDPLRGELFRTVRGGGAHVNGRRLAVSSRPGLDHALIGTGFPFRTIDRLDAYLATFRAVLARASGIRRPGSASIDLAWVAAGRYDGFWEEGLGPWDVAAGSLLIEEAGGVVSDFLGGDDWLAGGTFVAGTPGVHRELREIVARCQAAGRR